MARSTAAPRLAIACSVCSLPQGSFLMWIELPEAFDAVRLNAELRELKIQVAV
jgi:DNA-binding transcriptional MocR family regulator